MFHGRNAQVKRVLVVDSTWPVNARTRKIIESLSSCAKVEVCAWDRGSSDLPVGDGDHVLRQALGYGNKWKKLANLWLFLWHFRRVVMRTRPDIVVASHWECMFIAAWFKSMLQYRLVYDCLDVPTTSNAFILKLLWWFEHHFVKKADLTLFASRFFEGLYPCVSETFVLENLPQDIRDEEPLPLERAGSRVISWIGVVRYLSTLQKLVDACEDLPEVELHVFGDGPDLNRLREYSSGKRVFFHGRYDQKNLPSIYAFSDLVWAAYPSSDFNVRYAISNKYHECLKFGVPALFSRSTMLGEMVDNAGTGVSVDEGDIADIRAAIRRGLSLRPAPVDVMSWEQAFRLVLPRILGGRS